MKNKSSCHLKRSWELYFHHKPKSYIQIDSQNSKHHMSMFAPLSRENNPRYAKRASTKLDMKLVRPRVNYYKPNSTGNKLILVTTTNKQVRTKKKKFVILKSVLVCPLSRTQIILLGYTFPVTCYRLSRRIAVSIIFREKWLWSLANTKGGNKHAQSID